MTVHLLFFPARFEFLQLLHHFLDRESRRAGAGHEFTHQLGQPALPLRIVALDFLLADECPRALLGFQHAADFQFAVGANHGVRVDRQIHRQLPDSRKLIARGQRARRDAAGHLVDDLAVTGTPLCRSRPEPERLRFSLQPSLDI